MKDIAQPLSLDNPPTWTNPHFYKKILILLFYDFSKFSTPPINQGGGVRFTLCGASIFLKNAHCFLYHYNLALCSLLSFIPSLGLLSISPQHRYIMKTSSTLFSSFLSLLLSIHKIKHKFSLFQSFRNLFFSIFFFFCPLLSLCLSFALSFFVCPPLLSLSPSVSLPDFYFLSCLSSIFLF